MTITFREVPAVPERAYPGLTEAKLGDRCWQVMGTGEEAREALRRVVDKRD